MKANAYGHGTEYVVPALTAVGCQTFFAATPLEGADVRRLAPNAAIYVLNGLLPGTTKFYLEHNLKPVLGDLLEYDEWFDATNTPAALQIDTGMNRSGMSPGELTTLAARLETPRDAPIDLIMSHLACGDEPTHSLNTRQLEIFEVARQLFPSARASLANSAATLSARQTHYDLVRPGISLYGGRAVEGRDNPTEPVARVYARVIKIRDNWDNDTVGYRATRSLADITRLATIAVGYADGFPRHLSVADGDDDAFVWCAGQRVPIVGRISMDLTTIDISSLPDNAVKRGDMVEIFGTHLNVDQLADRAGTIGYELLTQLSRRFTRSIVSSDGAT